MRLHTDPNNCGSGRLLDGLCIVVARCKVAVGSGHAPADLHVDGSTAPHKCFCSAFVFRLLFIFYVRTPYRRRANFLSLYVYALRLGRRCTLGLQ